MIAPAFAAVLAFLSSVRQEPEHWPEVGAIAPALGELDWQQLEDVDKGRAPNIAEQRGRVVVVHTYGHFCDPCVRIAIPLIKRIHAAWAPEELRIFSLTALIASDEDDTPLAKAKELGLKNPMAPAGSFGESSPWLNLNRMPGLTYTYVVGKSGGVTWAGDPSRDGDEFLAALGAALAGPAIRPLPETVHPELAPAVAAYVAGNLQEARMLAEKTGAKSAKKRDAQAERAVADAAMLVALVDGSLADFIAALEAAVTGRSAENVARALDALRRIFPNSDETRRAVADLVQDDVFVAEVERWQVWLDLERTRPPTFPERNEKQEKRFAKELEKYLKKNGDGPGAVRARAWLDRFGTL